MMKKFIFPAILIVASAMFNSCGTSGSSIGTSALSSLLSGVTSSSSSSSSSSSTTSTTTSVISSLLSNLLSSSTTLSQDAIVGTWNYEEPDCVFESENFLMKAGGEVAATKIESQLSSTLAKAGIKSGSCSFTFNKDNTYSAVIGGKSISGSYTLDTTNKTIKMTYLAGLGSMTPHISLSGKKLSLLYESDKLLKLVSTVSSLSGNSTLSSLSSIANSYDGMYIGMKLSK